MYIKSYSLAPNTIHPTYSMQEYSTISLNFAANLMKICLEKRGVGVAEVRGVEKLAEKLKLFAVLRIFA